MNGLEKTAAKIHARYYPPNRKPYHDWERKTISVSKLVPHSPTDYAASLIAKRDSVDEGDEINAKWGMLGNGIADIALQDLDAQENNVSVPLGDGWSLTGHFDGADAHEDGVVIAEHKFFLHNESPSKTRDAMRQGALYLAMGWNQITPGQPFTFDLGEYQEGVGKRFTWPANLPPLGIVVACSPSHTCEERIELYPLTAEDCAEILAFFIGMAQAVRDSCIAGTLEAAQKWESDHPTWPFSEIATASQPIPELEDLAKQLSGITTKLTPPPLPITDEEADALSIKKDEVRELLRRKMRENGAEKYVAHGLSINLQGGAGASGRGQKLVVRTVRE